MTGQTAPPLAAGNGPVPLTKAKAAAKPAVGKQSTPSPPPTERPPFTVSQIREAIPAHCFERSVLKSFGHLFLDLIIVGVLVCVGVLLLKADLPLWAAAFVWPVYWYTQGSVMTGVWVIAHECGHQAFSPYKWLNNAVGLVCHSALLVPYHSWRITHGNHHKNTCSMENDEVFVPPTRSAVMKGVELLEDSPAWNLFGIVNMLLLGWPLYLALNVAGPAKNVGKPNSHFNPHAVLFKPSQAFDIVKSDIGLLVALVVLGYLTLTFGWTTLAALYFVPYLVVNAHLVLITYLQHTAPYIPHYRAEEFDWLRGALSTVDRSFGPVLNHLFHHITDTHVVHHLFHTMPFYNAVEATEAVKKLLGPYYLKDDTPIFQALYTSWSTCKYVEDSGSYLHFKSQ